MGRRRVSIIGAGRVGSTAAQILACKDICDIVLWNRTAETAEGIALDISESAPIEGFDSRVIGTGNIADIAGSDVVVITAGAQRKEGMSRDELLSMNASIVGPICEKVKKYAPSAKLVVLTNPLDPMVYLAMRKTGFPRERIMGMAGILDSSRFRSFIAAELKVSVKSVSAVVLGSHGDSMVPLPAHANVDGTPITKLLGAAKVKALIERTRDAGAEIIKLEKESSAFYAPASALVSMIVAMLQDTKAVLPCSAYLDGEYGVRGVFVGVPVVLGTKGIVRVLELKLTKQEQKEFLHSVELIKSQVTKLGI